jgi:hypothetical protein
MRRKLLYLTMFVFILTVASNAWCDLVAYWKMDEGSGDTIVDSSGNGHDGTLNGTATWTTGQIGLALHFDGSSTYAQIQANPNLDLLNHSDFSVSVWLMLDEIPAEYRAALQQRDGGGTGRTWLGYTQGDFYNYHGAANRFAGITPEAQTWYHVAYVVTEGGDEDTMQWYIDGDPTDSHIISVESNDNGDYLIGCHKALGNFWPGLIDDVRIYNHAMTKAEILAAMEGSEDYPYAFGPEPTDGALIQDTWSNLNWSPGDFAVSHDIYIGDNFDDVDVGAEGTFVGNQTDTFAVVGFPGFAFPDGLGPGTTYYWRIDEVNETEPNSPWKGNIWSFSVPPKTAYFPDPVDGAEVVPVNVELSWTGGYGSKLHTVYFGEIFNEVDTATGGQAQGNTTYTPGTLRMAKTYYWRVDEFDIAETHKGDVWSFTTEGAVSNPNPANGAVNVTQTPTLAWTSGVFAHTHEVYFGADPASLELRKSGNLGEENFEPGELEWNTTYYWRIEEANNAEVDSPWTGPLWNFTTANFLIIDDMESYNDLDPSDPASKRIFNAWIDGFDNPAINGSIVGHANPPFAEQAIVHGGLQSMPFAYDNTVGKSEATLTLTSNNDWTVNGVNRLTIWYRGSGGNAAEQMYVVLNGSARIDHDDPDAATITRWKEWNIELQAFADQSVNLSNVNSITLGLDSVTGGAGTMYFDDIRLYPPAP